MSSRSVLLVAAVLGAGAVSFVSSCTAPDPSELVFSERPRSGSEQTSSGGGSSSGGGGDDAGPADPIFGTDPFAYVDPGVRANDQSMGTHGGDVEGRNCVDSGCHGDIGPMWAFAGTVYETITGGGTVAEAEIRVVDPDGKEFGRAYTDADGNFWLEKGEYPPAGSRVGVRRAGGRPMYMAATIEGADNGAGCNGDNGCHGMPTQRIYAPLN